MEQKQQHEGMKKHHICQSDVYALPKDKPDDIILQARDIIIDAAYELHQINMGTATYRSALQGHSRDWSSFVRDNRQELELNQGEAEVEAGALLSTNDRYMEGSMRISRSRATRGEESKPGGCRRDEEEKLEVGLRA